MRIEPDQGLVVTLPQRAPATDADRVLRELDGWISPRLAALHDRRERIAREGAEGLAVLGVPLALVPESGRARVRRAGDRLLVPEAPEARAVALERWCRTRARAEAGSRLGPAAATLGVTPGRLRITDTRTRWGSCSATGTISLSWRLVLAPVACLDYVIWHEACHLVHPHHRPAFWALLERHRPDWREPSAWLREHGPDLRLRVTRPSCSAPTGEGTPTSTV